MNIVIKLNLNNIILQNYPIYWQGTLALKNDKALVEMHYLFGNAAVAEHSLQRNIDGELKLSQRMRLEQTQLDGVSRKMQVRGINKFKENVQYILIFFKNWIK
jgi:hypothetical protein